MKTKLITAIIVTLIVGIVAQLITPPVNDIIVFAGAVFGYIVPLLFIGFGISSLICFISYAIHKKWPRETFGTLVLVILLVIDAMALISTIYYQYSYIH